MCVLTKIGHLLGKGSSDLRHVESVGERLSLQDAQVAENCVQSDTDVRRAARIFAIGIV